MVDFEMSPPVWPEEDYDYDESELCENLIIVPEYDDHDREPDDDGYAMCGGTLVSTGGHHHYTNGFDCYTMYLLCDRCGPYEVECV